MLVRVCKKQAFSHIACENMNWFGYLEMQLDNATKL